VRFTADPVRLAAELRSDQLDEREAAWRELWNHHYHRIYRLAARFGVEPAEVEDVVQRAFVVAYRRIREVDDVRDPLAWLRGITVRVVAQHRRWRAVRRAKRWLLRDTQEAAREPVITPERSVIAAEDIAAVRRVLGKLSPKLRDALVMCDIEELRPGEAAEILGVSVNTVRSRRRLARERFTQLWEES
jgi:RNA polymerase sigma-70 factor (ECF subfamily)